MEGKPNTLTENFFNMAKYYYAILSRVSKKLLVTDGKLPIYWNKRVAQKVAKSYNGSGKESFQEFIVCPINIKDFQQLLQSPRILTKCDMRL
jgi:hypothetical protein